MDGDVCCGHRPLSACGFVCLFVFKVCRYPQRPEESVISLGVGLVADVGTRNRALLVFWKNHKKSVSESPF